MNPDQISASLLFSLLCSAVRSEIIQPKRAKVGHAQRHVAFASNKVEERQRETHKKNKHIS